VSCWRSPAGLLWHLLSWSQPAADSGSGGIHLPTSCSRTFTGNG